MMIRFLNLGVDSDFGNDQRHPSPLAQKTIVISGHSRHPQRPSPVSAGFVAPMMTREFSFRPETPAASMARTLTLREAPDALLVKWAQSQLAQIEFW
jgi:hypothetical protein